VTDGEPAATTDVDRRILEAVRSLDYGSVEVVVHDSQVVQIERREKVRLDKSRAPGSRAKGPSSNEPQAPPTTGADPRPVSPRRPRQAGTSSR